MEYHKEIDLKAFLLAAGYGSRLAGISSEQPKPLVKAAGIPLICYSLAMLRAAGVEVAGIEYILDRQGRAYTYDINVNTNYNTEAERKAGKSAFAALCGFLAGELARAG